MRAYSRDMLHDAPLTSDGPEIHLELLYFALRRGAACGEIPGHLDWDVLRRSGEGFDRPHDTGPFGQLRLVLRYAWLFLTVSPLGVGR